MDYSLRTRAKARDYIRADLDPNVVVGFSPRYPTAIDRRYRKCYVSPDVDIEETILPAFLESNGKVQCAEASSLRDHGDRKSTRLNSSHVRISYAVFCLKKKKTYA